MRKISNAESMDNGIVFFSNRHKNYVSMVTIDEQGEINAEWISIREYKNYKKINKKHKRAMKLFYFVLFLVITVFSILIDNLMSRNIILGIRFFFVGFSLILVGIFLSINIIERKDKDSCKFHSAEHMVLNAYKTLKRIPSLTEIRQFSRFDNYCGTNIFAQLIMDFSLMFICTFIPNPTYLFWAILSVNTLVLTLVEIGFLNFLQKFTTKPPADKHLIAAIKGLSVLLENEN